MAEEAKKNGLPVCKLCEKGIFLKSTNSDVISSAFLDSYQINSWLGIDSETWNKMVQIKEKKDKERTKEEKEMLQKFENVELPFALERAIIRNCIIEDVGGFMYAENSFNGFNIGGVKRTSNFYTGYMIPTQESLDSVVIEPQLHSRYALGTPFVQEQGQMIYYVELSSAVYTFSFDFDDRYVGKTTFVYGKAGEEVVEDRKKRIEVTLDAIQKFLIEFMFGAKKTRFLPTVEWESLIIAVSDDVWTIPSPFTKNYVEKTRKKMEKVKYNTKLFVYPDDGEFEDVVINAMKEAKSRL